jgi:uncharacterized protein YdaU (DUF1376 family)
MSETPISTKLWIPIYIADYLADTCRLTTEQHGAYLLLIFDYWRNGALPDDDVVLAQVCRLSPDAWSMHRAVLRSFFTKADDGLLHQKRIDSEMAKAQLNRAMSVTRAKKAAEARWSKDAPSNAPSILQALPEQCPSPSPTPLKTKTSAAGAFALPDWIDREAWQGFEEMRRKQRKPMTDRALGMVVKKLDKLRADGNDVAACLNQSTMRSYLDVFPVKSNVQVAATGGSSHDKRRFVNPADAYSGPEYAGTSSTDSAQHTTHPSGSEAAA